ncbi:hypothetical protein GUJ93_ZPchr0005g15713 [Zizania palustris]|uniref:Uncharacterized protein n=1 Tax=Zizania palustris TaxID=103762 RepID=A0A8J5W0R9_ZIZPA|nr:hypothetical protein GUJ93_ZPchr0005g15713 [Zizania palustris]
MQRAEWGERWAEMASRLIHDNYHSSFLLIVGHLFSSRLSFQKEVLEPFPKIILVPARERHLSSHCMRAAFVPMVWNHLSVSSKDTIAVMPSRTYSVLECQSLPGFSVSTQFAS